MNFPEVRRSNGSDSERSLADMLQVIWKRKVLMLIAMLIGVGISSILMLRPRRYVADGAIRIEPGLASAYRISPIQAFGGEASDKIASDVYVIKSRTLYLQVAKALDLANDPAFVGKRPKNHASLEDAKTREKLIRLMNKRISVAHSPKNEIVTITADTTSPALSQKIVNELINDYITHIFQMHYHATSKTSGWLIQELAELKSQVERDQATLISLQSKLGIIGIDPKTAKSLSGGALDELTKAASAATIDRILTEARYRYLKETDPGLIESELPVLTPTSPPNSLLHNLRAREAEAASAYSRLLSQFGPRYPDVKEAKAQLDSVTAQVKAEENRIVNQAKLSYSAADANEKMTQAALERARADVSQSNDDLVKYSVLLHDYEAHRTLYEGLVARLKEAQFTSGMESGEIDIVDLADLPAIPQEPGPLLLLLAGILGGLMAGGILAFLVDALDNRIGSMEEAEAILHMPLLSTVPHATSIKANNPNTLEVSAAPRSRYAESIQLLRTAIMLSRPDTPPQVILITSALPGEGKSTTARNLAGIFSQHHGKTLLIDCDLRRGRTASALNIESRVGLSAVLSGQMDFRDAITTIQGLPDFTVLPSGSVPPDPAVLIASARMANLIAEARQSFRTIILDCPPTLGLPDVLTLNAMADARVLVVRYKTSHKNALKRTRDVFASAHITMTGFIMNDIDQNTFGYGYGYNDYFEETAGEA